MYFSLLHFDNNRFNDDTETARAKSEPACEAAPLSTRSIEVRNDYAHSLRDAPSRVISIYLDLVADASNLFGDRACEITRERMLSTVYLNHHVSCRHDVPRVHHCFAVL